MQLPGYRVESVRSLGSGQDHAAVEVNGELIVRFALSARTPAGAAATAREAALLAVVARVSPLRVPVPAFSVPEQCCLAYPKLPGTPLLERPRAWRERHAVAIGASLGELLAALHRLPPAAAAELVDVEVDDTPPDVWLREAVELYAAVRSRVPPQHRPALEAFLATSAPPVGRQPVFSHNDLGIEHVLVDAATGQVTGVIDWSDAAFADIARDFALILRDLGPPGLHAATARDPAAGADGRLGERVWFHARCAAIEDLAYGAQTGRSEYESKSLDALSWLFAE